MARAYVLYNPIAGNGQVSITEELGALITDETVFCDITKADSYEKDILSMENDDYIVVCGGDGTLNRFANKIAGLNIENDIRYFPCGTGNDFARELGFERGCSPFSVKKYIYRLPTVTVGDEASYFINGVGYGIDGYCCEVGDKLRAESTKPVNYTAIAVKGLLFHYKPTNAKVTVDGKEHEFKKVWIAPTMNGKYYGGGMMPTPAQDRLSADGRISVMLFHGSGKLKTFMIFPSLFKGEHVKNTKYVTILEGYDITVEFDEARTVQVDGETVFGVTSYRARSAKKAPVNETENEVAAVN